MRFWRILTGIVFLSLCGCNFTTSIDNTPVVVLGDSPTKSVIVVDSGASQENATALPPEVKVTPRPTLSDLVSAQKQLVLDNTDFGFSLLQNLSDQSKNLIFSPYGVSIASGMAYAGARADTERQMADVLHFTLPQPVLHPAFHQLNQAVIAPATDAADYQITLVNGLWGQAGFPFRSEYKGILEQNYDASIKEIDFSRNPDAARDLINQWVYEKSAQKIENLIPDGIVDNLTRLIITNTLTYHGGWLFPFDKNLTREAPFYLQDSQKIILPYLHQTNKFNYLKAASFQVVELPYKGKRQSLFIILPDEGKMAQVQASLTTESLNDTIVGMKQTDISLSVPRFQIASNLDLAGILTQMGMPDAFSLNADFSGMDGSKDLYVKSIVHNAWIALDEAGTDASAASGVVVAAKGMPAEEPLELTVDRPFFFLLQEKNNGTLLFLGRVTSPERNEK